MMIFWRTGLAILAVPKTGSETLQDALWPHADIGIRSPPTLRHMNRSTFGRHWAAGLPETAQGQLETLAVVREPVDWLASWYRYRTRGDVAGTSVSTRGVSFAQFVEAWLRDRPPDYARVGRQSRFCAGPDGRPAVDHVFAYERPATLHSFLKARLGIAVAPARRNVSPRADTPLPDALRQRLYNEAGAEFALHARARR
ncbi:MAG: gamma-glutamyl kinase [Pseudomonadota bacterium]